VTSKQMSKKKKREIEYMITGFLWMVLGTTLAICFALLLTVLI